MGRPTNRYAARRDASLARMAADISLPPRQAGESHGAYYRRCAVLWLDAAGDRDPEHRALIRTLGAIAQKPKE